MLNDIKKDAEKRMQKSVDSLKHELQRLRTGRASTALIEPLKVSYYGTDTPVMQVANVAIADARSITITPYEKTMVGLVEKAIFASDLGLTPTTVGNVIRINLPPLTEERRKELSKHVVHEGENESIFISVIGRSLLVVVFDGRSTLGLVKLRAKRASFDIAAILDEMIRESQLIAASAKPAFADITDEDIDSLFS